MSGIAGVFYLDGRPVEQAEIERMTDILAHRGPDDGSIWCDGVVGLGHRMLWTTPESLREKLPLANSSGDLVITADARIDNRDELLPLLGLDDRPAGDVTDSQVILNAYEKWSEQCPEKLLGDFAFAIWDSRRQVLFCARDIFGDRPFYYYHSHGLFVFSSEIKSLFCLPEVPRKLDEVMVGYYLSNIIPQEPVTFYQDIVPLPARYSLTVSSTSIRMRCHWTPDPSYELKLGSDEEYAEAFQDSFRQAVQRRLRSAYPIGSELSGGLDSSFVTAMARDLLAKNDNQRLKTFSAVFDKTPESDEREFINAIVGQGNVDAHFVNVDNVGPLVDMERIFWLNDQAYIPFTGFINWEVCREAHKQGVRVLLTGLDGDTIVSHGLEYLTDLALASMWDSFAQETKALARRFKLSSARPYVENYGFSVLAARAKARQWGVFSTGVNGLTRHFNLSRRVLWKHYVVKPMTPQPVLNFWRILRGRQPQVQNGHKFIDEKFARQIDLDQRLETMFNDESGLPLTARASHAAVLTGANISYMAESANQDATAFSMETRHPFTDRQLAEFCLALPPEQKLHQGWTRMIMRRAMTGMVPEKIQWRVSKTLNSAAFTRALLTFERDRLEEVIINEPGQLVNYVNLPVLRDAYCRYLAQQTSEDEIKVARVLGLALWLRHIDSSL